jgi:hypothetical protein
MYLGPDAAEPTFGHPRACQGAKLLQIVAIMTNSGQVIHSLIQLPGCPTFVSSITLASFTGKRFLSDLSRKDAPPAPASLDEPPSTRQGGSCGSSDVPSLQGVVPGASSSARAVNATEHMLAIFKANAPEQLSIQEVLDLVCVTKFYMADAVLCFMAEYLEPLLSTCSGTEVRHTLVVDGSSIPQF